MYILKKTNIYCLLKIALNAQAEEFRSISLECSLRRPTSPFPPFIKCRLPKHPPKCWLWMVKAVQQRHRPNRKMLVELGELSEYIEVSSGHLVGSLYLEKFELSKKRNVAKCLLVEDKLLTLGEFETKSGKKAKNWRKSVKHGGVPLNNFITDTSPCKPPTTRLYTQASNQGVSLNHSSTPNLWPPELTNAFSKLEERLTASVEDAIQNAMGPMHRLIKDEVSTLTLQLIELQQRVDKLEALQ